MSKIIDFVGWKQGNPLSAHETMIRALIRDINVSFDPTLTATKNTVTLTWRSSLGELNVTMSPSNAMITVDAHTNDGHINLKNVSSTLADNNRWIGYLFDDNMT